MANASISRMMLMVALCCVSFAQNPLTAPSGEFAHGVVIEKVITLSDPSQSYALFLPSNYTPSRKWPIFYAFDPLARGKEPTEMLKAAAEKYGYIVAGSNNSRNGPIAPEVGAAKAMWADTHKRLSIDDARIYATGFSGGARLATALALQCKCKVGVFAIGAGFPVEVVPSAAQNQLLYFSAVGEADFNYPEMTRLQKQLDEAQFTSRMRQFEGGHRWAPSDVAIEAVEWFELHAMKKGLRPADQDFIISQFAKAKDLAQRAETSGDVLAAAYAYDKLAQDFQGLREVKEFSSKAAELKESKAYKDAQRSEQNEIKRQSALTAEIERDFSELKGNPDDRQPRLSQLRAQLSKLRVAARKPEAKIEKRALNQMIVMLFETGDADLRKHDFTAAISDYDLLGEILPDSPGPYLQKARVYAISSDKKRAVSNLRQAADHGFKDLPKLLQDEDFTSLKDDAEFKKLMMDATSASAPANK